jgi:hypothetical protein
MSSFNPHHRFTGSSPSRGRRRGRTALIVGAAVAAVAAVGLTLGLAAGQGGTPTAASPSTSADPHAGQHGAVLPPGYKLSGEQGPMGGQVIETPGTRSGSAAAGGIVITDGADIAMGHIPLAFAVDPTWHLRNTSDHPVTLGTPKVAVVKGCCPADPQLGASALAPGEETTLRFLTQMHPGMDGDHLFRITVPVSDASEPLTVSVAGDFS